MVIHFCGKDSVSANSHDSSARLVYHGGSTRVSRCAWEQQAVGSRVNEAGEQIRGDLFTSAYIMLITSKRDTRNHHDGSGTKRAASITQVFHLCNVLTSLL